MQSIKKVEETKLFGKQESPEIDSVSDTEEGAPSPFDSKAALQKLLSDEIAQNIKAENPLSGEGNVKNQLALNNPNNIEAKGEDEEEVNATKAFLEDEEELNAAKTLLKDEEMVQSQAEEDAIDTEEQPEPMDTEEVGEEEHFNEPEEETLKEENPENKPPGGK